MSDDEPTPHEVVRVEFELDAVRFVVLTDETVLRSLVEHLNAMSQSWTVETLAQALREGGVITFDRPADAWLKSYRAQLSGQQGLVQLDDESAP